MGSDVLNILFTIFLVFLNGFFVAAEFAIVKVRASQVETKSLTGNRLATNALRIVNNLDAYLSATQLGITLASLALGWVGEPFVAELVEKATIAMGIQLSERTLEGVSFGIAFSFITVMHIVFGELAPKSIAIRFPEKTTMFLSFPLRIFYVVFKPAIWVLNGFANFVLRVIGIPLVHEQDTHTEEEIRLLLEESTRSGNIKSTEHELLENVFKFDDRTAEQIMIPRTKMIAVELETSIEEVVGLILDEGYSRMPVYNEKVDNIVGILHTKDVLKAILADKDRKGNRIEDLMREPFFVLEKKSISLILRELQREHVQMAIVLDEFGGTSGILTMEDIVEELVGDIQDEYDNEMPVVQPKSDTEFIVDALANIEEVNRFLPEDLPIGENYETVSGYLNEIFGHIPEEQEKIENENYKFTVLEKSNNAVHSVLIKFTQSRKQEKPSIQYE